MLVDTDGILGRHRIDDPRDGRIRPRKLADPQRVNELRAEVGLEPLRPILEQGPDLPAAEREQAELNRRWWEQWLVSKGWRG